MAPMEQGQYRVEKVIRASGEKFRDTHIVVRCHVLQALNACQKFDTTINSADPGPYVITVIM